MNRIWQAFIVLNGSRPAGMGPSPIPLSEIQAYCQLYGIQRPDEIYEFVLFIQTMDRAWMDWAAKKEGG